MALELTNAEAYQLMRQCSRIKTYEKFFLIL